jgi:hypothetical protein
VRKIMIPLILASATVAAVPASGQSWRLSRAVHAQIQADINQLQNRIFRAERRRTISRREAIGLRRDAAYIRQLYARYSRNGLNRIEVADLETRINRTHQRLRIERRDWDGRRG